MERFTVDQARVRTLRKGRRGKGPVVYWMSRDQRVHDNWALLHAQEQALVLQRPLVVVFCLSLSYPGANVRHFGFLLRGLQGVQKDLAGHGVSFVVLEGDPPETLPAWLAGIDPALLVSDFDPLRIKRQWKTAILGCCSVVSQEVDAHNIVPCWLSSPKREYAAYTLRPKITRLLPQFLTDFPPLPVHPYSADLVSSMLDINGLLERVSNRDVGEVDWLLPGERQAARCVKKFYEQRLLSYDGQRNNPCVAGQSDLSPYFHFGQLAPQRVAWEVANSDVNQQEKDAFLEELIIRRELSDNFCLYAENYDCFDVFPDWAKKTLHAHRADPRPYLADLPTLESASTGEELWNSCQRDLIQRGKLHGYLRMYWGKKILEWSRSPEEALANAIYLNDKYALDGRDPNGYAGIAWCIGGVHDRAWPERPVFGKIRYMNENGCRRKFNVPIYMDQVAKASIAKR